MGECKTGPRKDGIPDAHRALGSNTTFGGLWEDWEGERPQRIWSFEAPDIFKRCGLSSPSREECEASPNSKVGSIENLDSFGQSSTGLEMSGRRGLDDTLSPVTRASSM